MAAPGKAGTTLEQNCPTASPTAQAQPTGGRNEGNARNEMLETDQCGRLGRCAAPQGPVDLIWPAERSGLAGEDTGRPSDIRAADESISAGAWPDKRNGSAVSVWNGGSPTGICRYLGTKRVSGLRSDDPGGAGKMAKDQD